MAVHLLEEPLTEIVNGVEIMTPSPFSAHQRIVSRLYRQIDRYVEEKGLGTVFFAPLDVIFEEGVNRLQPDLFFIGKDKAGIEQDWIRGVPDMVCEVLSKGTARVDLSIKREIYEKYGVPEYWIVMPQLNAIEILALQDNRYGTFSFAEGEGKVLSRVMAGLEIAIEEIFKQ